MYPHITPFIDYFSQMQVSQMTESSYTDYIMENEYYFIAFKSGYGALLTLEGPFNLVIQGPFWLRIPPERNPRYATDENTIHINKI